MSFKDMARREILDVLPQNACCKRAFLSAVARVRGSVDISARRVNLSLWLEDNERAVALAAMFKSLYPADFELIRESKRPGVTLRAPSGFSKQILLDFELMTGDEGGYSGFTEGVPQDLLRKECCKLAYFKGLTLACGNFYVPEGDRGGYHFELQLPSDDLYADDVMEILSDLRINTKLNERGEQKLLYVKDRDEIMDILVKLGLSNCALTLKGIIDDRETANDFNRAAICETANYDKVVTASARQIVAVAKLKTLGLYDTLSDGIKEVAEARVKYPDASMQELADRLEISKSCLNHRFRKIAELSASYGDEDERTDEQAREDTDV